MQREDPGAHWGGFRKEVICHDWRAAESQPPVIQGESLMGSWGSLLSSRKRRGRGQQLLHTFRKDPGSPERQFTGNEQIWWQGALAAVVVKLELAGARNVGGGGDRQGDLGPNWWEIPRTSTNWRGLGRFCLGCLRMRRMGSGCAVFILKCGGGWRRSFW
jgi:hypothetical protein